MHALAQQVCEGAEEVQGLLEDFQGVGAELLANEGVLSQLADYFVSFAHLASDTEQPDGEATCIAPCPQKTNDFLVSFCHANMSHMKVRYMEFKLASNLDCTNPCDLVHMMLTDFVDTHGQPMYSDRATKSIQQSIAVHSAVHR